MANYIEAPELAQLGAAIIEDHYPHLAPVKIAWVMRSDSDMERGRAVAGHTYREPARQYALHGFDFTICIAQDVWDEADAEVRFALLDHQIAFIGLDYEQDPGDPDTYKPKTDPKTGRLATHIRKPDVMEFEEVVVRHGAFYPKLRSFLIAFSERKQRLRDEEREKKRKARRGNGEAGGKFDGHQPPTGDVELDTTQAASTEGIDGSAEMGGLAGAYSS